MLKLLKLSQNLVELADEAVKTKKLEENSSPGRKEYYNAQLKTILSEAGKAILEYSEALDETSKKEDYRITKVKKAEIKEFAKTHKLKKKRKEKYSVYKTNFYSKISNFFMEDLSFLIARKYPDTFRKLSDELTLSNIKVLSRTYLSIVLFTTLIALPIATVIAFVFLYNIWFALGIGIAASILVFIFTYSYPTFQKKARAKQMDQELVFAFIHMSAIASSGAPPLKIFKLLLDSEEYKNLQSELERVLNYINIFGYNLTTSLKAVASTTPSARFKDFLHGLASTLETGGGIKEYLRGKSEDELTRSRLEQQKYLETISTFSEIYIGVLIAAPLLFVVTLAILERISPDIAGISINTIGMLGVFGLLPILNILFLLLFESSKSGK